MAGMALGTAITLIIAGMVPGMAITPIIIPPAVDVIIPVRGMRAPSIFVAAHG